MYEQHASMLIALMASQMVVNDVDILHNLETGSDDSEVSPRAWFSEEGTLVSEPPRLYGAELDGHKLCPRLLPDLNLETII